MPTPPGDRAPSGGRCGGNTATPTERSSAPPSRSCTGRWWDGTPGSEDGTRVDAGGLARVSLEEGIANDLHVGLGDTITWEVGGVEIPSVVTSIRRVDWNRLEPNFFAIFEPGSVDEAPQTIIMVARIPDAGARASFQRALVGAFPNVSALDFSRVQSAIDEILSRVRQAVAFLGLFSALAGVVVLIGALASSRVQRMREGALLKTLGARRRQVLVVLFAEYLALGTLATATGLVPGLDRVGDPGAPGLRGGLLPAPSPVARDLGGRRRPHGGGGAGGEPGPAGPTPPRRAPRGARVAERAAPRPTVLSVLRLPAPGCGSPRPRCG